MLLSLSNYRGTGDPADTQMLVTTGVFLIHKILHSITSLSHQITSVHRRPISKLFGVMFSFRNTTLTQNFSSKWHLRPQSNQYYSGNNHSLPQSMFYSVHRCLTGLSMPLELSEMGNLKHPQCITLSLRNTTWDLFINVNHVLYNMTSQGHFGEIEHEHALLCKISTFSH